MAVFRQRDRSQPRAVVSPDYNHRRNCPASFRNLPAQSSVHCTLSKHACRRARDERDRQAACCRSQQHQERSEPDQQTGPASEEAEAPVDLRCARHGQAGRASE